MRNQTSSTIKRLCEVDHNILIVRTSSCLAQLVQLTLRRGSVWQTQASTVYVSPHYARCDLCVWHSTNVNMVWAVKYLEGWRSDYDQTGRVKTEYRCVNEIRKQRLVQKKTWNVAKKNMQWRGHQVWGPPYIQRLKLLYAASLSPSWERFAASHAPLSLSLSLPSFPVKELSNKCH